MTLLPPLARWGITDDFRGSVEPFAALKLRTLSACRVSPCRIPIRSGRLMYDGRVVLEVGVDDDSGSTLFVASEAWSALAISGVAGSDLPWLRIYEVSEPSE